MHCSPLGDFTAAWVRRDAGVEPVLRDHSTAKDKADDAHCFSVEYTNASGSKIHVYRADGHCQARYVLIKPAC